MLVLDSLSEILYSLRKNAFRTLITAFGVFWGVYLLVVLMAAGEGLKHGIESELSANAQDSVWLWSARTSVPYKGRPIGRRIRLTEADVTAIKNEIPGVSVVSAENPMGSWRGGDVLIRRKELTGSFGVFGVGLDYFLIKKYQEYREGRRLSALDDQNFRKVVTMGTLVAERLFPNESPIGKYIEINNVSFRVVGLFYDRERQGRNSERIYMPLSIYQRVFGRGESFVSLLTYQPDARYDPYLVEEQVVQLLKKRHRVSPKDKRAIRFNNTVKNSEKNRSMIRSIVFLVIFVGMGTLLAGAVGVSNIMMITVKERTVEVGVRKALGAKPQQIVFALLLESFLVTAVAGYLGLVSGVVTVELLNFLLIEKIINISGFLNPQVDFSVAAGIVGVLVMVSVLAGLFPALRAATISPVQAMRGK